MTNKLFINEMFNRFNMHFPATAEKVVDWYRSGRYELTFILNDETKVIYNDSSVTIRTLTVGRNNDNKNEEDWKNNFGTKLYNMLISRGVSQTSLSEYTGITELSIHNYIYGKTVPSGYNLYKIANALDCSVSELIE